MMAVLLAVAASTLVQGNALDDYIAAPDPYYNYSFSGVTREGNGWTAYMYIMTSQKWMTEAEVNHPIWTHQLAVIIPHEIDVSLDSALIYITGGDNKNMNNFPHADDEGLLIAGTLAVKAKSPGAVLWQVPNQPLKFPCDPIHQPPEDRSEDQIISLTFWHFVQNTSDPNFLAYFPMTKSAVKALDTLTAVVPLHSSNHPTKFYVAGASKRGWTTWLTGAVDSRVVGIMPIVLDALHLRDCRY